ncbi:GNAT family N-acetyltransferase [Methylocapsa palsarum]|uniref:GNAT family N-acetyltransferase n=1 Tax=Methylocapsa palsarum TaxID=1612308 RepID=UPI001113FC81|nr:GNAT family N-acetyltransferase [Methylocapsa palsarum]
MTDHLLRLAPEGRRLRFLHAVDDATIKSYGETMFPPGGIVLGCFREGVLRAVGELRPRNPAWGADAEVAISVESEDRHHGVGTELLRRLVEIARNRSITRIRLTCLVDNAPMQKIVRNLGGDLYWIEGEVEADIVQPRPSFSSLLQEAFADFRGLLNMIAATNGFPYPGAMVKPRDFGPTPRRENFCQSSNR